MLRWLSNTFRWLVGADRQATPPESPSTQRHEQRQAHHQSPKQPDTDTAAVATSAEGNVIDYFNNEHRRRAEEEDRLMKECYDKATEAREDGDHESANKYVEEAKKHKAEKVAAHKRGKEYVLSKNPTNQKKDVVDLHGLRVDEALEAVEERIGIAKGLGYKTFQIITGRGNHSLNNQAKIKPKIKDFLKKEGYKFEEDKDNPGSLTVFL